MRIGLIKHWLFPALGSFMLWIGPGACAKPSLLITPISGGRTLVETEGGTLRLRIPARGFRGKLLLAFVPLIFFDVALFSCSFSQP